MGLPESKFAAMKGVANPPSPKKVLARFTIDARLLSSTWLAKLLAAATTVPSSKRYATAACAKRALGELWLSETHAIQVPPRLARLSTQATFMPSCAARMAAT